jgi:uncharacterized OB-fold protein
LPEVGSSLGKAIRGFKEASDKKDPEPAPKGEVSGATGKSCPHCGKGVATDAVFCPSCGKKISDPV